MGRKRQLLVPRIPKVGDPFVMEDLEIVLSAIEKRQANFPDEPAAFSMVMIMMNIGDRYAPVTCINGEWSGFKQDLQGGEGIPKCPNGHVLTQGKGLRLGWIDGE